MIKKEKILKNVFLLTFENQFELTSTLLRFQEYYESPKFKGKIFTLKEFEKWSSKNNKKFSFSTYAHGLNFPSYILKPFFEGKFNPLSKKEKQILKIFEKEKGKYYIIAYHKKYLFHKFILKHEIAHALFYIDLDYREKVLNLLSKYNIEKTKKKLEKRNVYHKDVLDDEIHAFSLEYINKFMFYNPILTYKLRKLYKEYFKKYKIN